LGIAAASLPGQVPTLTVAQPTVPIKALKDFLKKINQSSRFIALNHAIHIQ